MDDLKKLDIGKARDMLLGGGISAIELTRYCIERIESCKYLNAFITISKEEALESASYADRKIKSGDISSPLLGIPIAVKDLFCTKGIRTTAGSKMLDDFIPAYESTVTSNLLKDGAIFLGKTNMDEFAMGSSNSTSYYGAAKLCYRRRSNPDMELTPGGSSGGSASAVSAGLAISSIGSDTGGSIRQPAAFSGLVGIKPTYGLCSRYGMIAFASSLDQAGPISKNVRDAAIMLSSMAGYDEKDPTSLKVDIPDYTSFLGRSVRGLRVGLVRQYMDGLSRDGLDIIEKAQRILEEAGCEFIEVDLKLASYALSAYYIIAPAEASSNLARYDGVRYGTRIDGESIDDLYIKTRSECFGEEVKRRIMTGTYVLSSGYYDAYYTKALKIQKMLRDDFKNNAFAKVDILMSLTTPGTAFGFSESIAQDTVQMYLNDIFTVTANITGLPAISIPAGISGDSHLPMGIQLIGNRLDEGRIFSTAEVIERAVNFEAIREQIISVC